MTFFVNQDGKVFQKDLGPNAQKSQRRLTVLRSGSGTGRKTNRASLGNSDSDFMGTGLARGRLCSACAGADTFDSSTVRNPRTSQFVQLAEHSSEDMSPLRWMGGVSFLDFEVLY